MVGSPVRIKSYSLGQPQTITPSHCCRCRSFNSFMTESSRTPCVRSRTTNSTPSHAFCRRRMISSFGTGSRSVSSREGAKPKKTVKIFVDSPGGPAGGGSSAARDEPKAQALSAPEATFTNVRRDIVDMVTSSAQGPDFKAILARNAGGCQRAQGRTVGKAKASFPPRTHALSRSEIT